MAIGNSVHILKVSIFHQNVFIVGPRCKLFGSLCEIRQMKIGCNEKKLRCRVSSYVNRKNLMIRREFTKESPNYVDKRPTPPPFIFSISKCLLIPLFRETWAAQGKALLCRLPFICSYLKAPVCASVDFIRTTEFAFAIDCFFRSSIYRTLDLILRFSI